MNQGSLLPTTRELKLSSVKITTSPSYSEPELPPFYPPPYLLLDDPPLLLPPFNRAWVIFLASFKAKLRISLAVLPPS